jgi:drug/metabolite transporter (DMT)-like permease
LKSPKEFGRVSVLGIVQTTFQYSLMYIGTSHTTAAKSSILTTTGVFFIAIIAHFMYKNDKLTKNKIIGLLVGFSGIIVSSLNKAGGINFDFSILGEGLIIGYQLCSAIASIFVKNYSKEMHPVKLTVWQMFIGSAILLIIGLIKFDFSSVVFPPSLLAVMLYLVAVSAVSYTLWNTLLKYNKAAEISIFKFATPLAGTFLSCLIMGDALTIRTVVATILVSLGVFFVYYKKKTKQLS